MSRIEEKYRAAVNGKKIPIVALDHKWHTLFLKIDKTESIAKNEEKLNELLKRQGKCNTETKDIKKLKKKMMDEIVNLMEVEDKASQKKVEDNKRLINECNEKIEQYQEELMELPRKINEINKELMLETMDICYEVLHKNENDIKEIADWVKEVRIELKKNVIRKQEMEIENREMYAYMHDIFGADVINLFDMKYNPLENEIKLKAEEQKEKKEDKKEE